MQCPGVCASGVKAFCIERAKERRKQVHRQSVHISVIFVNVFLGSFCAGERAELTQSNLTLIHPLCSEQVKLNGSWSSSCSNIPCLELHQGRTSRYTWKCKNKLSNENLTFKLYKEGEKKIPRRKFMLLADLTTWCLS